MTKDKKNKGITLVAMIVTIIILMILAGIAIGTLKNSNLFENAKIAKEKYINSQNDENSIIDDYSNQIENYRFVGNGRDINKTYIKSHGNYFFHGHLSLKTTF